MNFIEDKIKNNFYRFGENIEVGKNVVFQGLDRIYIGSNIQIKESCEITVNSNYYNKDLEWNIKIDNNSFFNRYVCIEAFNQIIIGKYVMFGPQVYVSDKNHKYDDSNVPIMLQGFLENSNKVIIKDGSWIGSGSRIIGNLTIGFGSVVAANTVVIKDVPNHSVVAGVPSRIIKIYNYKINKWINVKNNPQLLKKVLLERGHFSGYDYEWINEQLKKNDKSENTKIGNLEECNKYKQLVGTIIEGLNHIAEQLIKGEFNKTINIFNEMVEGIYIIINRISVISKNDEYEIVMIKEKIQEYLNLIVSSYENRDISTIVHNINESLIPILIKLESHL